MRKFKLIILVLALLDLLAGYGGLVPLTEAAAAQQVPANPITTQQITMPVFTLGLAPATGASVQLTGNPGPKVIFYWVVAKYTVGNSTVAGPFAFTQGPNTLSGTNFVTVRPLIPLGATSYDLLKTTTTIPPTGACACAVTGGTGIGVTTAVNDQNNATGAYTVNTFDLNTLTVTLQNEVQSAGVSHLILRQAGVQVADISVPATSFPLRGPADSASAPNYSWAASTNTGMFFGTSAIRWTVGGTEFMNLANSGAAAALLRLLGSQPGLCFGSDPSFNLSCFWQLGSQQVGFGTSTIGDFSGILRLGGLSGGGTGDISGFNHVSAGTDISSPKYLTSGNCSSAASPAVCAAAPAGRVVIAAAASTVQVNTTIVTAASEIKVQFDESLTGLGTCNTAAASESAHYFVSARSAGASFTIKTSSAPVTNPACLTYTIVN